MRAAHLLGIAVVIWSLAAASAAAAPRNPYSGFNLSGVNYGAQQWDRAQREGRRVWPYDKTPNSVSFRGSSATKAGGGSAVVEGSGRRLVRRWRR